LIKELWAYTGNRITVRYAYEWRDDSRNGFRSYGNENWEFGEDGLMIRRVSSINDLPIGSRPQISLAAGTPSGRSSQPVRPGHVDALHGARAGLQRLGGPRAAQALDARIPLQKSLGISPDFVAISTSARNFRRP